MRFQQAPYRIADVVALLFILHGNTSFGSLAPIIPYRSCKHYLTLAVLGYRIKEIASLLGMSEANTKVRISRARHMLRAYILQEENQVEQEHDIS